ncbi:MAG TPA: archease [Zeimonas sp.]|nr:archease [Zeimonas sp.]
MEDRWEHYEHDADVGVRGIGSSMARAFEQAGLALTAVVTDPASVRCERPVEIACEAPDAELLFAEWLNAIVYEMAVRRMLFGRFEVRIDAAGSDGMRLAARAWGEATSPKRHAPAAEIKAATYTTLRVAQLPDGRWLAQTVVDV